MALVRSAAIVSGLLGAGGAVPRSALGAQNSFQIVGAGGMYWSKKAVFLKNSPFTIEHPHDGQVEIRSDFGHAAQGAAGRSWRGEALPAAAALIKSALNGKQEPHRMNPQNYPSVLKHTYHTLEQIDELKAKIGIAGGRRGIA